MCENERGIPATHANAARECCINIRLIREKIGEPVEEPVVVAPVIPEPVVVAPVIPEPVEAPVIPAPVVLPVRQARRFDGVLARRAYFEDQVQQMCPMHALNNLLQEKKMLYPQAPWPAVAPEWVGEGGRDGAKLNMPFVCQSNAFRQWSPAQGITIQEMRDEEVCQQNGVTGINLLRYILSEKLGYDVQQIEGITASIEDLRRELLDPSVIGIIVNTTGHFAAISNYVRLSNDGRIVHAFMEPFYRSGPIFLSTDDIISMIRTQGRRIPDIITRAARESGGRLPDVLNGMLVVRDRPEAYASVAAQRLRLRIIRFGIQQQPDGDDDVRGADRVIRGQIMGDVNVNLENIQRLMTAIPELQGVLDFDAATQILHENGDNLERAIEVTRERYGLQGGKRRKRTTKRNRKVKKNYQKTTKRRRTTRKSKGK